MSKPSEGQENSFLSGLPKATTPGDIGAVGLGLALGYFAGVLFLAREPHSGFTPGSAAVYISAAALGIKNTVQSVVEMRRMRTSSKQADPLFRAKKVDEVIEKELTKPLPTKEYRNERRMRELLADRRQWLLEAVEHRKAGVITDDELDAVINPVTKHWAEAVKLREEAEEHAGPRV